MTAIKPVDFRVQYNGTVLSKKLLDSCRHLGRETPRVAQNTALDVQLIFTLKSILIFHAWNRIELFKAVGNSYMTTQGDSDSITTRRNGGIGPTTLDSVVA